RQHEHVLAERAVAAISVARAPELIAVSLIPVAGWTGPIGRLPSCGFVHPCRGENLHAVPLTVIEIKQSEPGDVLRAHVEPVGAGADSLRTRHPGRPLDAEFLEQSRLEVVEDS